MHPPLRAPFLALLVALCLILRGGATMPPAHPAFAQDSAAHEDDDDGDDAPARPATVGEAIREALPARPDSEDTVYAIRYLELPNELVYDIDRPMLIDRIHIDRAGVLPVEMRAAQVEVLVTPVVVESEDDFISVGEFELPATENPVACSFEPIEARFVKLIVTASWGGPNGKVTGVRIGRSGGSLSGTVVDADGGQPLPGATVALLSGDEAVAGEGGRFDLPHLPSGAHRLAAWRAGYSPFVRTLEIDSTRSRSIEVRLTRTPTDLFGFVRDEAGYVIEAADVTVKDTMQSVRSDGNGMYLFRSLKAGTVEVVAAKEGFRSSSARVFVSPGRIARLDATLSAGADREPPEPVKLSPFAYLPSDPKSIGSPAGSFYLAFDEPVDRAAINIGNYRLNAYAGDPESLTRAPHGESAVAISGIAFHPGDPSGRTLRFHLALDAAVTSMPFLELTVVGVADALGNAIPEPGRTIRNFSPEDYRLAAPDGGLPPLR